MLLPNIQSTAFTTDLVNVSSISQPVDNRQDVGAHRRRTVVLAQNREKSSSARTGYSSSSCMNNAGGTSLPYCAGSSRTAAMSSVLPYSSTAKTADCIYFLAWKSDHRDLRPKPKRLNGRR